MLVQKVLTLEYYLNSRTRGGNPSGGNNMYKNTVAKLMKPSKLSPQIIRNFRIGGEQSSRNAKQVLICLGKSQTLQKATQKDNNELPVPDRGRGIEGNVLLLEVLVEGLPARHAAEDERWQGPQELQPPPPPPMKVQCPCPNRNPPPDPQTESKK